MYSTSLYPDPWSILMQSCIDMKLHMIVLVSIVKCHSVAYTFAGSVASVLPSLDAWESWLLLPCWLNPKEPFCIWGLVFSAAMYVSGGRWLPMVGIKTWLLLCHWPPKWYWWEGCCIGGCCTKGCWDIPGLCVGIIPACASQSAFWMMRFASTFNCGSCIARISSATCRPNFSSASSDILLSSLASFSKADVAVTKKASPASSLLPFFVIQ